MKSPILRSLTIFTVIIVISIISFNFIISCTKEKDSNAKNNHFKIDNSRFAVINGVLHFKDAKSFFEISNQLGTMTEKERDRWEKSIGFVSLRRELNKVFSNLSQCDDQAIEAQILVENSDIIGIKENEIVPRVASNAYAAICNRDGIFYVEGIVHKVVDDHIFISEDGEIASIEKAIAEGKIQEGISKIQYFKDAHVLLKSGECGTNKTAFAQSSDRKCDFEIKTYEYICAGCCGNFYDEARVELIIKNYKKNIWGNWKGYQTKCYYDNVAFTVIAPIVTGFNGTSSIFYYKAITVNVGYGESDGDWETYSKWWKVGDQVQNVNIYDPKFDRVKGKASNRGLLDPNNPKWAEINCGIW